MGHAVAQLVETLRYNLEGRGVDFRWCQWHNPSGCRKSVGSTETLTKSVPGILRGKGSRYVRLTTLLTSCRLSCNLGTSSSRNPKGLPRPVTGSALPVYYYIWKTITKNKTLLFDALKYRRKLPGGTRRQELLSNSWQNSIILHGVAFQRTVNFIVTDAVT